MLLCVCPTSLRKEMALLREAALPHGTGLRSPVYTLASISRPLRPRFVVVWALLAYENLGAPNRTPHETPVIDR
jgi:hypothetical protein